MSDFDASWRVSVPPTAPGRHLKRFHQQFKATKTQNCLRDFLPFERLPESMIDPAIDIQIGIFEGESQGVKGLPKGSRFGAVVIEERAICIEP